MGPVIPHAYSARSCDVQSVCRNVNTRKVRRELSVFSFEYCWVAARFKCRAFSARAIHVIAKECLLWRFSPSDSPLSYKMVDRFFRTIMFVRSRFFSFFFLDTDAFGSRIVATAAPAILSVHLAENCAHVVPSCDSLIVVNRRCRLY